MDNVSHRLPCLHACNDGLYVTLGDYCKQCYLAHSLCTRTDKTWNEQTRYDARVHQNQNPTCAYDGICCFGRYVACGTRVSAIGLERLAPLGAVAIGGLVVGTLMTLIFIPVGFVWLVEERGVIEED